MAYRTISGALLRDMIISGTALLEKGRAAIDALNVFPVPDGDTGTNMSLTMASAMREVRARESARADDISAALSRGALRGARGNSGVILSQLWRGFAKALEGYSEIDVPLLGEALRQGAETAYKAVMKPREGTILSVARTVAEAVCASEKQDLEVILSLMMKVGEEALLRTPEQLPVLKQAGVVDAGGKGLLLIYAGFRAAYLGEEIDASALVEALPSLAPAQAGIDTQDILFAYCTEFFIVRCYDGVGDIQIESLRDRYAKLGDSVIVVGDAEMIKVHVHSNDPGRILQAALRLGELSNVKIDNMREQHRSIIDEPVLQSASVPIDKEWGVVAVAAGDGLSGLFRDLASARVVEGGQTMNPSIEELSRAITDTAAEKVFILPNNANIIMAAQQAAGLFADRQVAVIPTQSVPQGIAALMSFMPAYDMADNQERMAEAMAHIKTGQVTYAVRASQWDGGEIAQGDSIGLYDGEIRHVGPSVEETTLGLLGAMIGQEDAIVTLFYGVDVSLEDAETMAQRVAEMYDHIDVEFHSGGQPLYHYLISVE